MQLRAVCKSKIHRATVTGADLDYIGSIAIDEDLLRRTDIIPGEKVHVWNINNGERIETYALPAPAGSGQIVLNGAAARKFRENDKVIIAAFVLTDELVQPRMILVDELNKFMGELGDNTTAHDLPAHVLLPANGSHDAGI
jgi:aspartate 1-decarboxylase